MNIVELSGAELCLFKDWLRDSDSVHVAFDQAVKVKVDGAWSPPMGRVIE